MGRIVCHQTLKLSRVDLSSDCVRCAGHRGLCLGYNSADFRAPSARGCTALQVLAVAADVECNSVELSHCSDWLINADC